MSSAVVVVPAAAGDTSNNNDDSSSTGSSPPPPPPPAPANNADDDASSPHPHPHPHGSNSNSSNHQHERNGSNSGKKGGGGGSGAKVTAVAPATAAAGGGGGGGDRTAADAIQSRIAQLEAATKEEEDDERRMQAGVAKGTKEIHKIIAAAATAEEKADRLLSEYLELLQKCGRSERDHTRTTRKCDQLTKEKEVAASEVSKATSIKSKLENLCRELQKENKRIKEESRRLAESEQQKREELSNKFQSAISEIKTKMEEGDEKLKRIQDSEQLKERIKNLMEQYNLREQHFNSILKSKDLELQLSQARLAQQQEITETESLRAQVAAKRETELHQQLELYTNKFEQVQHAINQSNDVFNTFKQEMEQMSKKLKKLEKENETLRSKCDTLNHNILEMVEERTKIQKQKARLETLCRALQNVNKDLRGKLEKYGEDADSPNPASPASSKEPATKGGFFVSIENSDINAILDCAKQFVKMDHYEIIELHEDEAAKLFVFSGSSSKGNFSVDQVLNVTSKNLLKGDKILALQIEIGDVFGFVPIACQRLNETEPMDALSHEIVELRSSIAFRCKVTSIIAESSS